MTASGLVLVAANVVVGCAQDGAVLAKRLWLQMESEGYDAGGVWDQRTAAGLGSAPWDTERGRRRSAVSVCTLEEAFEVNSGLAGPTLDIDTWSSVACT